MSGPDFDKLDAVWRLKEARTKILNLVQDARDGLCDTANPTGATKSLLQQLEDIDGKITEAMAHLGDGS